MRRRLLLAISAVPFALALAIGAVHLPAARPLLSWFASRAGCPVSLDGGDAATLEAHRSMTARARAGTRPARTRPASSFQLGTTVRSDVERWIGAQGAHCESSSAGAVLRCRVPKSGTSLDAYLQFDPSDRLVAMDLWHPATSADMAVTALTELTESLATSVGPSTKRQGSLRPGRLAATPLGRVAREFRYSDYFARLSVTNLGTHGVRLREQYQWVPATM